MKHFLIKLRVTKTKFSFIFVFLDSKIFVQTTIYGYGVLRMVTSKADVSGQDMSLASLYKKLYGEEALTSRLIYQEKGSEELDHPD